MLNIGLTGGIGCGKSTVTKILAELGASVMDADKIAHSTYAPGGPAYDGVVAVFGQEVPTPDGGCRSQQAQADRVQGSVQADQAPGRRVARDLTTHPRAHRRGACEGRA